VKQKPSALEEKPVRIILAFLKGKMMTAPLIHNVIQVLNVYTGNARPPAAAVHRIRNAAAARSARAVHVSQPARAQILAPDWGRRRGPMATATVSPDGHAQRIPTRIAVAHSMIIQMDAKPARLKTLPAAVSVMRLTDISWITQPACASISQIQKNRRWAVH
jgi:hypothetical protein